MEKETSHMKKYLSRGKQLLKTPYYLYCVDQTIEKKYNAFSCLSMPCQCIVYPSSWLNEPSPTLSQFQAFPSSYFLVLFAWEIAHIF